MATKLVKFLAAAAGPEFGPYAVGDVVELDVVVAADLMGGGYAEAVEESEAVEELPAEGSPKATAKAKAAKSDVTAAVEA